MRRCRYQPFRGRDLPSHGWPRGGSISCFVDIPAEGIAHEFRPEPARSHPKSLLSRIGTWESPSNINESELLNRLGESLHAIEFLRRRHSSVSFDDKSLDSGVGIARHQLQGPYHDCSQEGCEMSHRQYRDRASCPACIQAFLSRLVLSAERLANLLPREAFQITPSGRHDQRE